MIMLNVEDQKDNREEKRLIRGALIDSRMR